MCFINKQPYKLWWSKIYICLQNYFYLKIQYVILHKLYFTLKQFLQKVTGKEDTWYMFSYNEELDEPYSSSVYKELVKKITQYMRTWSNTWHEVSINSFHNATRRPISQYIYNTGNILGLWTLQQLIKKEAYSFSSLGTASLSLASIKLPECHK